MQGCCTFSTKPGGSCGINNIIPQKKCEKLTYLDGQPVHASEPPLSFVEALIARHSEPRDLVVDPFVGAGITGVACVNLLRRFRGVAAEEKRFQRVVGHLRQCYKDCIDQGTSSAFAVSQEAEFSLGFRSLSEDLSIAAPEAEKLAEIAKLKYTLRRSARIQSSKQEVSDDDQEEFDEIKDANEEFISRACAGVFLPPPYYDPSLTQDDMLELEAAQCDLQIKDSTIPGAGKG